MKRHIHIISIIRHAVLGGFLAALVLSLSVPRVSAAEISPDTPHPAVARIMSLETNAASFGSGTLIYKQGKHALLVTNHHVIRDSKEENLVSFPNGFRSSAKVVASDPTWDLAALLIWSPSIDPVQITKKAPQTGDELTIAGYGSGRYRALLPSGRYNALNSGRCYALLTSKKHKTHCLWGERFATVENF